MPFRIYERGFTEMASTVVDWYIRRESFVPSENIKKVSVVQDSDAMDGWKSLRLDYINRSGEPAVLILEPTWSESPLEMLQAFKSIVPDAIDPSGQKYLDPEQVDTGKEEDEVPFHKVQREETKMQIWIGLAIVFISSFFYPLLSIARDDSFAIVMVIGMLVVLHISTFLLVFGVRHSYYSMFARNDISISGDGIRARNT